MEFLKSISGRLITGAIVLAVIAGGISWWQMDPETRRMLVSGAGKIIGWLLLVAALPWATFFVSVKVAKLESNLAGGILVFTYTALEVLLLAWLFDFNIRGAAGWTFLLAGGLLAGVYNLFTCDWIAEKFG